MWIASRFPGRLFRHLAICSSTRAMSRFAPRRRRPPASAPDEPPQSHATFGSECSVARPRPAAFANWPCRLTSLAKPMTCD